MLTIEETTTRPKISVTGARGRTAEPNPFDVHMKALAADRQKTLSVTIDGRADKEPISDDEPDGAQRYANANLRKLLGQIDKAARAIGVTAAKRVQDHDDVPQDTDDVKAIAEGTVRITFWAVDKMNRGPKNK